MGTIIGIDLGTTYSAVAIAEQRSGPGFYAVPDFPGFSIIVDDFKRRIMPSVVAEDGQGNIVVGHTAKGRAGLSPEPIMFAKRWMGQDKVFHLAKQGDLRPVDVSAHLLRALKKMAEVALRETVTEAVITVPAYFSAKAKQMTQEAAEQAGLRVVQLAQEPVAAAIMYCAHDTRDPLRVLTYDLGGGTFDVAILEKKDGTISAKSVLAFDGDAYLGGYDFDTLLAQWIADQLVSQKGYNLHLDMTDPADREIFAKLMIIAERVKIKLSEGDSHEINDQSTGIKDHSNADVTIELRITRDQFEAMIRRQVDYTIELCHRARTEKAKPAVATFDEILLVGGSSRIPMISARLKEVFGLQPRLLEPDLCVALGAAAIAGSAISTRGCLRMGVIPAETDLTAIEISGQVVATAGAPAVAGSGVSLRALDASYQKNKVVSADGGFAFSGVPLAEGEKTDFALTVTSAAGVEVETRRFSVRQTETPSATGPIETPNVLSKPIGILWADGIEIIAPERTPLPCDNIELKAVTTDASGRIQATVYELNTPIGELVIEDIPTTLPVGSEVKVTVTIRTNYKMTLKVWVTALSRGSSREIDLPLRPLKTPDQLRKEFDVLVARAQDARNAAGANVLFGDGRAKRLDDRLEDCKRLLEERTVDVAKVQDRLDEIEGLIRAIGQGWRPDPPKSIFDHAVAEATQLHEQAKHAKPEIAGDKYENQIEAIRLEAEKAYNAQNPAAWGESYQKIQKLCDKLNGMIRKQTSSGGAGSDAPKQDSAAVLLQLSAELAALEKSAGEKAKLPAFAAEFRDLKTKLEKIVPKSPNADSEIWDWYNTGFLKLKAAIEKDIEDGVLRRVK